MTTRLSHNKLIAELTEQVKAIRNISQNFKSLSNDELRQRAVYLSDTLCSNHETDSASSIHPIDHPIYATEAFAIMLETMRRFTKGPLRVTANTNDRLLARNTEFVTLYGKEAVYHPKWDVDGVPYTWQMIPYDVQILGGLLLARGHAVEMATGEGKTLVAVMPVFLQALYQRGVHVMTANDYLSKRDYLLTRPLYAFHGLTSDCIEKYDRMSNERKLAYQNHITFGTCSGFIFDYLYDHLALRPEHCVQQNHVFALIDELDSILIDEAETEHIIASGTQYNMEKYYQEQLPLIRELVETQSPDGTHPFYSVNQLHDQVRFTVEGETWLAKRLGRPELFKNQKAYQIEGFNRLSQEERQQIEDLLLLQNILQNLLTAFILKIRDVDYIVEDEKIKIIDSHTGRIMRSRRWSYGIHTAVEAKEGVKIQRDSDSTAVISLKNYFKLYKRISGMSGTLLDVADELREHYGLECIAIPTHRPMIRVDHPLRIFRTHQQRDTAIVQTIQQIHASGRPILVATPNIKRADELAILLTEQQLPFRRLDAKNLLDEAQVIAKAGQSNTITLATSVAGRGTDIKPSTDALTCGGLCVIGTDLFESIRTNKQVRGRSGRQGNPGSSYFFASLEDRLLYYLSKEEQAELQQLATCMTDEELSSGAVSSFFLRAQEKQEQEARENRSNRAQKDDLIAPHRNRFYNQRNRVLKEACYAHELLKILFKDHSQLEAMEEKIKNMGITARELTQRILYTSPNTKEYYLPFSVRQEPYIIEVNTQQMLTDSTYFNREFKRQNILHVYDKHWNTFVIHLMQNLDQHEINELEERYWQMQEDILIDLRDKLMASHLLNNSNVTTSELTNSQTETISDASNANSNKTDATDRRSKVMSEQPCPCGSGKKYGECHGKNIHHIPRRRR